MSTLNAENPATERGLTDPFATRAIPRWRTVRSYGLQIVTIALFFVWGMAITAVSPLVRLFCGFKRSGAQEFVRIMFRFYARWLQWSGMFRLRFEGFENVEKLRGAIIAANHPGLLDAIILITQVPRAVCIMRADLRNPCLAGVVWLSGYIRNDRGAGLIRDCRRKLAEGDNLLIFPEGTRTRADARGVNRFKSGFALAAVVSGAPIQTVFIERSGAYLGKGTSLLAMAHTPIEMTIHAGEIFHALPGESAKELSSRLETYFRARLANTDDGIRLRA